MEPKEERKEIRQVDRIKWRRSFPLLTNRDINLGLFEIMKRAREQGEERKEGKAVQKDWGLAYEFQHKAILVSNSAIQNMMNSAEI